MGSMIFTIPRLMLKRMRREWRSLTILLLAVCLLTGFFALGPFYVRAVTEVGLRYALDTATPEDKQVMIIVDNEPLTPDSFNVVRDELGDLATGYRYYVRADYTPPTSEEGLASRQGGRATLGYDFRYGEPVTAFSSTTDAAYQPFAFDDMPSILNLVEGRWPVRLSPPSEVSTAGLTLDEQEARQIGPFNRGQVEVVVTQIVAEKAHLELGSRWVIGTIQPDGTGNVASVVVVGIVEPKDPTDSIWEGNRSFLEGSDVEMNMGEFRYDYGMATVPEAYTDWIRPVTPGNSYIYVINTNTDVITADNIQNITGHLNQLQNRLGAYHPGVNQISGLASILESYSGNVDDTEGPIIFLSGAVLLILLYHLINTVALVLEQQGTEWSTIVSRGGSIPQLVMLQLMTVGVLGIIGMAAGPLFSLLFMRIMEHFGPLATALGGQSLINTGIPTVSYWLSLMAAVLATLVLTGPALPAALRSLLSLKQLASRPPVRPVWARYFLDFVLMGAGGVFLFRMYYLIIQNETIEIQRRGRMERVSLTDIPLLDALKEVNKRLASSNIMDDPFNLLGPALLLTGLALLWLRFYPLMLRSLSRFSQRSRHLTTPLAIWNVARDPGHYAQLVLLLIGTLALGTASLSLSATRDRGAWSTAQEDTGSGGKVQLDPAVLDASTVEWNELSGVDASTGMMHATGLVQSQRRPVHILGVNPDQMPSQFSDMASITTPLRNYEAPPAPGIELPENAQILSVQVYSLPPDRADDPAVTVELMAYLQDALGIPYRVPLAVPVAGSAPGADENDIQTGLLPTPTEEWLTLSGEMPELGHPPYRLMRIGINSVAGNLDAFHHTMYFDLIATQDAFGTSTPVESFEEQSNLWAEANVANPYAGSWSSENDNTNRVRGATPQYAQGETPEMDGATTLRIDYDMGMLGGRMREPSIVVNEPTIGRIPVVITRAFAERFKGVGTYATAADVALAAGNQKNIMLNVGPGTVEIGYEVVGVVDDVPGFPEDELLIIAPIDLLQPVINQAAASNQFFAVNEIWLNLPDREPSDKLERQIAKLDGVETVTWAWTRYREYQREPLPSAVTGMLFAGFWVSLALSLLDFAFYLVVTAKQRSFTFGVLRSLGWDTSHIWRLLFIEQFVLITPALVIGSLIGAALAYLLLPVLSLVGGETLRLPWWQLAGMLALLVVSFTILMGAAAVFLRRMSVNQVLRLGEE